MKRKIAAFFRVCLLSLLMALFASCAQDGDGPLDVMPNGERVEGNGYFLAATLDSGKTLHLISDTLYVTLSQIWSFSNCSLASIDLNESVEDSVFVIAPKISIKVNTDDCPSPMYRPDTTFKMVLKDLPSQVTNVIVKNDVDSLLDSIMLRRGKLERDTFRIFIDSAFAVPDSLPLRTKESPSIVRVLDSITPQKFFWRTLRANCTMRVDKCNDVVADTIYPTSWRESDTALVPVRYSCASADSVFCLNSKWEYDSTALGKVNERLDTIWHMSTYYIENIPSCAMMNGFVYGGFAYNSKATFVRELFVPDENERSCGPSTKKDWIAYRLESNNILTESDDGENKTQIDSLYKVWKSATVALDTLRTDSTESK
ncbi:hypothetical protein [Fibrobacter sp. UWB12]|uniref:hypothetical protein n=1 Tax=Fibrobacter sp. UWB12 TaxID=1896203 RepID=UPI00091B8AEE|nr:hypothetical protein [Fibrobacter sp. UWB12]SHK38712.1 hypothetical protein SAMN05720759_102233 [Fibrobacter sp. UWB12]